MVDQQMRAELAKAAGFILLIGEHGIGKWQVPEYDEALDLWVKSEPPFPLVVVLLEGETAPGLPPAPAALDRHARPGVREGRRPDFRRGIGHRWIATFSLAGPGKRSRRSTHSPSMAGCRSSSGIRASAKPRWRKRGFWPRSSARTGPTRRGAPMPGRRYFETAVSGAFSR